MLRIIFIPLLFLFAGCTQKTIITNADKNIISGIRTEDVLYPYEVSNMRFEIIRDTALIYSTQCSLRYYYKIINKQLLKNGHVLDRVFDFQPLLLENDILPPVVIQSERTVEKVSNQHLVVADRTFRILKNGLFITAPLSWKSYLLLDIPEPTLPDRSLLPGDNTEQEIWSKYVEMGWAAGKEQAFMLFKNNLADLSQDYLGMVSFHRLFQQGLMTAPIIKEIESGVTQSKDVMIINQRILAIAQQGFLEGDHRRWHSYIYFTE
jgi:defect-in-organelle-trafficking protein DotC